MLEDLTKAELVEKAKEMGRKANLKMSKAELIKTIEEEEKMEENKEVVVEEEVEVKEGTTYVLDDGTEGTRSAYIRQEFKKDRSRKEIAKELDVKYYVVYSATANMYNAVHKEGDSITSGRASTMVPKVNAAFQFLGDEDEIVETADEAVLVPRTDLFRDLFDAGVSRKAMQDFFSVAYATVYAATKGDTSGTRVTHKLIHPTTGAEITRADYIRELFAQGMNRKEIAAHITGLTGEFCDYSAVYAATKADKEEEEEVVEAQPEAESEEISLNTEE